MIRIFQARYASLCWKCGDSIERGRRCAYVASGRLYCEPCAKPVMLAQVLRKEAIRDASRHAIRLKESDDE